MNRKKIIGIITLITLAAILLNGCGGSSAGVVAGSTNSSGSIGSSDAGNAVTASEAEPDGAKEANSEEAAVDQETAITEAVTEEGSAVDEGSIEEQEIRSEEETEETALEAETFPETVFFDKNDIKITGEGFSLNEDDMRIMHLTIINNSASEIKVRGNNAIIDGYVVGINGGDVEVAAGETASAEFYFNESDLKLTGITSIHDVSTSWFITGDGLDNSSDPTGMIAAETNAESTIEERDVSLYNEIYNASGVVILTEPQPHADQFNDHWMYIFCENDSEDRLAIDTILHLADGRTRTSMNFLYPHSKLWKKQLVHDGDSYYVRVSIAADEHNWDKIAETEERTITIP